MAVGRDDVASELRAFAGFLTGIPQLVRRGMSAAAAEDILRARLANREQAFLETVRTRVFGNHQSPYRALFDLAGCALADVEQQVHRDGVEGTLAALRRAGVYVGFEEFKGERPLVRHGREIPVPDAAFDNPRGRGHIAMSTGGSTGRPRRTRLDLEKLEGGLPHHVFLTHLEGGLDVPRIRWWDLPPAPGMGLALRAAVAGERPAHWLSAVWPGSGSPSRFLWASWAAMLAARFGGAQVAWPRHVPMDRAGEIARLAGDLLAQHGRVHIRGSVSRMVRVAVAARQQGIDLTGATIMGGGEPPTAAKVAEIRASGAVFTSAYHFSEVGMVGSRCLTSDDPNDQHLLRDHLALIQFPRVVPGFAIEVPAFCFTTLLSTASKLLINVESDDYGTVEERACGCPWGGLGFTTHVRDIRSFRKLTGEGVTLIGTDIERILGVVLPRAHGGSALDYQLVEEEGEHGQTHVTLLVDPAIRLADEQGPAQTFLAEIRAMGTRAGLTHALWQQAGTLRVRRDTPHWTARGKLLPLHLIRHHPK
jgi:hypothetical protein